MIEQERVRDERCYIHCVKLSRVRDLEDYLSTSHFFTGVLDGNGLCITEREGAVKSSISLARIHSKCCL